jgi:hypothetical protein
MNGFLTRQAMRVLDPGHGVRPRVPTRFEASGHTTAQFVESPVERVHHPYGTIDESASVKDPVPDSYLLDRDAPVVARVSESFPSPRPGAVDEPRSPLESKVSPAPQPAGAAIVTPPPIRTRPSDRPGVKATDSALGRPDDLADLIGPAVPPDEPGSRPIPAVPAARPPTAITTADAPGSPDSRVRATPASLEPPGHLLRRSAGPSEAQPHPAEPSASAGPLEEHELSILPGTAGGHRPGTVTPRQVRQAAAIHPGEEPAVPVLSGTASDPRPRAGQGMARQQPGQRAAGQQEAGRATPPDLGEGQSHPLDDPIGPIVAGPSAALPGVAGPAYISISAPSAAAPPAVPRRARRPATAQAEAGVHVTIGTVEVTAVPPPAPVVRRPRVRTHTMTLSDYLTKRRGG